MTERDKLIEQIVDIFRDELVELIKNKLLFKALPVPPPKPVPKRRPKKVRSPLDKAIARVKRMTRENSKKKSETNKELLAAAREGQKLNKPVPVKQRVVGRWSNEQKRWTFTVNGVLYKAKRQRDLVRQGKKIGWEIIWA